MPPIAACPSRLLDVSCAFSTTVAASTNCVRREEDEGALVSLRLTLEDVGVVVVELSAQQARAILRDVEALLERA